MKHQTSKTTKISEGLEFEDMRGLVSNQIDIDRHKPKIGTEEDIVVVAFTVTYDEPARELSNFIETGDFEHLDVEASSVPNQDGTYNVFIEFQRDHDLFEKLQTMLNDIDQITSRDEGSWEYTAFRAGKEAVEFNEKNFRRDIVDSSSEYRRKYVDNTEVEESINRLRNLIKY